MLLADSHITMVVGVDVHVTTAPPFNPIHPYMGMVMDPPTTYRSLART